MCFVFINVAIAVLFFVLFVCASRVVPLLVSVCAGAILKYIVVVCVLLIAAGESHKTFTWDFAVDQS